MSKFPSFSGVLNLQPYVYPANIYIYYLYLSSLPLFNSLMLTILASLQTSSFLFPRHFWVFKSSLALRNCTDGYNIAQLLLYNIALAKVDLSA